ncbi:MAG: MFS transporter [Candidatus Nanoarchaeia archaeon]
MYSKQVWSWALYDFANTAFSALFVTFFFPLFVKEFLGGNEFQIGLVFGISMFMVALTVPVIGVLADMTGKRVKIIAIFTMMCVAATAAVGMAPLSLALVLGFLANYCYHSCLVVYNSVLPQLVKETHRGRVSGFGVSVGYVGTLVSLGMAWLILNQLGWDTHLGIATIFPATAIFFFVFSLPMFRNVPDYAKKHTKNFRKLVMNAFKELWGTIKKLYKYKGLIPFLLSSFAYSNATTAAIIFLYLYARSVMNMSAETFLGIFVIMALAAAVGSFFAGKLVDKISPKRTLVLAGILWSCVIAVLLTPTGTMTFVIAGCLGGAGLGTIWTANRPMILQLTPKMKPGEFFGFDELADKVSGSLEPILFGWLVVTYGYSFALYSLLVFFGIGLALLYWVPTR